MYPAGHALGVGCILRIPSDAAPGGQQGLSVGGDCRYRHTFGVEIRCLAQQGAEDPEAMQSLAPLGYRFQPDRSDETTYVFCKEA